METVDIDTVVTRTWDTKVVLGVAAGCLALGLVLGFYLAGGHDNWKLEDGTDTVRPVTKVILLEDVEGVGEREE